MSLRFLERILGKCPLCNAEDSIVPAREDGSFSRVKCEACGNVWNDYFSELIFPEKKKGNKLTLVSLKISQHSVMVDSPRLGEIPHARLIVSILNAALITRFKLRVCLATEGGVEGKWNGEYIELRNTDSQIGLCDDHGYECTRLACQEILGWYWELLKILFFEELSVGNMKLGRGAILKLSNDPAGKEKAGVLLALALQKKTGSENFAAAVSETLTKAGANPFSGPYLAGLSDKDIARIFVHPPL